MIKRTANILFLVTALFIAFALGFFAGRNFGSSPVQISTLGPQTKSTQPGDLIFQAEPETESSREAPSSESLTAEPDLTEEPESCSTLININTATHSQLMTLPGIGEVLAQRIVDYREANGPFPSVAALTNVSGIGEKKLAAIINLVTV